MSEGFVRSRIQCDSHEISILTEGMHAAPLIGREGSGRSKSQKCIPTSSKGVPMIDRMRPLPFVCALHAGLQFAEYVFVRKEGTTLYFNTCTKLHNYPLSICRSNWLNIFQL